MVNSIAPSLERPINSVALRAEFKAACRRLNVTEKEMIGGISEKGRRLRGDHDTSNRRQVIIYWLRVHKGGKLEDIGYLFRRTHPIISRSATKIATDLQGPNKAYWRGLLALLAEGEL